MDIKKIVLLTALTPCSFTSSLANAADAGTTSSSGTVCIDIISGPVSEDSCSGANFNSVTATSLNTGGSSATSVGNSSAITTITGSSNTINGATTINGNTTVTGTVSVNSTGGGDTTIGSSGSTNTITGITSISGLSGVTGSAVTINGTANGTVGYSTGGVLITGNASDTTGANYDAVTGIANWADVSIMSNSGTAGIRVNDYGVQILSPPVSGATVATNEFGTSTGSGTINNNIGGGGTSGGTVNNNVGNSNSGATSGSVTNVIGGGGGGTSTTTTNIGAGGNGTGLTQTNIGAGGGTGSTTQTNIGAAGVAGSTTTNSFGTSNLGGTVTNNIGTGSGASTNNFGNNNSATTITANAGNSSLSLANDVVSLKSGNNGITTYNSPQTLSLNPTTLAGELNNVGDAASRQNIADKTYVNRLEGNTLVNGDMYINGTLAYTSNTSATTTVTSGVSVLAGASQTTNGQMSVSNSGAGGAIVDQNGKITTGTVAQSTASLTLTNGVGNTHGIAITEGQTTISGGTRSSSMTLNDNGANFSNSQSGAPIQLHGVADGTAPFDAVNKRQLDKVATRAYSGVAQIAAMQAVPAPIAGKNYSLGMGGGFYAGQQAIAFGGKANVSEHISVGASVATGFGSSDNMAASVGAGFSW